MTDISIGETQTWPILFSRILVDVLYYLLFLYIYLTSKSSEIGQRMYYLDINRNEVNVKISNIMMKKRQINGMKNDNMPINHCHPLYFLVQKLKQME